jgi:hypothetical protein
MADRMMLAVFGALAFWTPVVLLEVLSNSKFSIAIANVLPVVCALCFYLLRRRRGHFQKVRFLPLYVLAGIYLFGPLSTTIAGHSIRPLLCRYSANRQSFGHF